MEKENHYLSKQKIIDHSTHPRNWGILKDGDFMSGEYNPSCGDSVIMSGCINKGGIVDILFEGKGCVLSVAMASMLTEHVKGMHIDDVLVLDDVIVSDLLGLTLGINRLRCGTLSLLALQKGLKLYQEKLEK